MTDLLRLNEPDGAHPPSWYAATAHAAPDRPPLEGEVRADVCVIGAGFTGLSAALHLAEAGLSVVVLEANRVAWGASGRNGGQIGSGQRLGQLALERAVGVEDGRRMWAMGEAAKALLRDLVARHGIDCDLREGQLHSQRGRGALREVEAEAGHLSRHLGYDAIDVLDRAGIAEATGSGVFSCGALDRGAGHLHPLNYALGLARAAEAAGARICERSRVLEVSGAPHVVRTAQGAVRAGHVIHALNGYHCGLQPELDRRVMPINNFIAATAPLGDGGAAILPQGACAADSKFVVNYWRKTADGRVLFGGGETYRYRYPSRIDALVRPHLEEVYPQLRGVELTHAWGGTLGITMSRLPLFHAASPTMVMAGGYSGHGVPTATLAGRILADAVRGADGDFGLFARHRPAAFPGGPAARHPLLVLAMGWYALRDRLGI